MVENGNGNATIKSGEPWRAPVSVEVIRHPDLSAGAKLLYANICSYMNAEGTAYPGTARLSRDLGASRDSIRRWRRELREAGYILTTEDRDAETGEIKRLLYTVYASAENGDAPRQSGGNRGGDGYTKGRGTDAPTPPQGCTQGGGTDAPRVGAGIHSGGGTDAPLTIPENNTIEPNHKPNQQQQQDVPEDGAGNAAVADLFPGKEILASAGIQEPTKSDLAAKFDADYLQAWVEHYQREKRGGNRIGVGLLVTWIRGGESPAEFQGKAPAYGPPPVEEAGEVDAELSAQAERIAIEALGENANPDLLRAFQSRVVMLLEDGHQPETIPRDFEAVDALLFSRREVPA